MEEIGRSPGFEAGLVRSSGELLTRLATPPDDVWLVDVIRSEYKTSEAEGRRIYFKKFVKVYILRHGKCGRL